LDLRREFLILVRGHFADLLSAEHGINDAGLKCVFTRVVGRDGELLERSELHVKKPRRGQRLCPNLSRDWPQRMSKGGPRGVLRV